jgi:hypothetical protein
MRTRDTTARRLAGGLACLVGACAHNPTPGERVVSQQDAISSGKGAYAFVSYTGVGALGGELIASTDERLSILTEGGHLVGVPFAVVRALTLGVHDNNEGALAAWGALGTLSTISHGAFLIFTLPLWLATNISLTVNESYRGLVICERNSRPDLEAVFELCLREARAYARFPQGLPPGVGAPQLLGHAPVPAAPPAAPASPPAGDGGAPETGGPAPYDQPS